MKQTSSPTPNSLEIFSHLVETVHRLRAPGGCPWDRAQTHQSLRQYLIEEAYEVLDVIDQIRKPEDLQHEKTKLAFREELGDLLMQVLLHSEMARETGAFDIYAVMKNLDEKLVRRHPHVFSTETAKSADAALQNWEKEKAKEKKNQKDSSVLSGMPKGLPALQRAGRVIEKVTQVGFQWPDMKGPLAKLQEELAELTAEIQSGTPEKIEAELGDVFFTLCNIAYLKKISPEDSLRKTLSRFEKRFRHVEGRLKEEGKTPKESTLPEMDVFWDEAKQFEQITVWGLTGGIASGKSTAARIFREFGIPVVDADEISREITAGIAAPLLQKRFGTADRKKLREIVFSDPQAKQDIEGILHPLIQTESRKRILALGQENRLVIYEAPLLIETGRNQSLNGLLVVETSPEVQFQRLIARDGLTPELANKIIAAQISSAERRKHADLIIDNSSTVEELKTQVRNIATAKQWLP